MLFYIEFYIFGIAYALVDKLIMEYSLKKLNILFLLLLITSATLSAKNLYIKVMTLSHSDLLFSAEYDINELGYTMFYSKDKKVYRVYAGVFENKTEASIALKRVQKHISKDAFIAELTLKDNEVTSETIVQPLVVKKVQNQPENIVKSVVVQKKTLDKKSKNNIKPIPLVPQKEVKTEPVKKQIETSAQSKEESNSKERSDIFLGIYVGASQFAVSQNSISGEVPLNFRLDERSINYGVELGYYLRNNIFNTINYQVTNLDNINFTHAFVSLNYKFDDIYFISPYVGVLGGYSIMTWKNSPIDSANTSSSTSSFMGGVQIGSEINVYKGISLYGFYRYILIDYTTNLKTDTGQKEIKHRSEQNLDAGIRYRF